MNALAALGLWLFILSLPVTVGIITLPIYNRVVSYFDKTPNPTKETHS